MQVLLEPITGGVRATTLAFGEKITADGVNDVEALSRLEAAFVGRLPQGARLIEWQGPGARPWMKFAGALEDEPLFDDWQESIRAYREEMDAKERVAERDAA